MLGIGSLSPACGCCAQCCGDIGVCLSCPDEDWSSLGVGDPVGGELGAGTPEPCTWYSAEDHTMVGTGSGRVEPDSEGVTHINWRLVTEGTACFEVTATVYTNADNDVAAVGVFTDAAVGIVDQGDGTAQVFWEDPDLGTVLDTFVNDPDLGVELGVHLCDGTLTYSVNGTDVADFPVASFPGVSSVLTSGGYAVFIEASGTGQVGALDFECVSDLNDEFFLATAEDGELILTTDGEQIVAAV